MRVLVVEHEELARRTLEADLSQFSFVKSITAVATEVAAGNVLSVSAPDVLFLDAQLPEWGAFRVVSRSWPGGAPVIICTTMFDRRLVEALSRHRVEYLVRPFSGDELAYVVTRSRRTDPIDPAANLERLLNAAASLDIAIKGKVRVSNRGQTVMLDAEEIAAFLFKRDTVWFWTVRGVFGSAQPNADVARAIDFSCFRRISKNAFLSTDANRFGNQLNRARHWLQWRGLPDIFRNRRGLSDMPY